MSFERSIKKRKYSNLLNLKVGLISLSIILLISTICLLIINFKQNKHAPISIVATTILPSIAPTIVSQDLVINMPYWWNTDFAQYSKIAVNNMSIYTLAKGSYFAFGIDHATLVRNGFSNIDASDFQLVYKNGESAQQIDFNIENPNSSNTAVLFYLQNEIKSNSKDSNYYLYFNNKNNIAPQAVTITKSSIPDQVSAQVIETIKYPFTFSMNRKWLLKGSNINTNYSTEHLVLGIAPEIKQKLTSNINQNFTLSLSKQSKEFSLSQNHDGNYEASINSSDLNPGEYNAQVNIKLNSYNFLSQKVKFNVSYPLYVAWSIDWEGFDVNNNYLNELIKLSDQYKIPMTHFFNPRIYETNTISQTRKDFLTNWIKDRIYKGDEFGMHLHMFTDMVMAAGVTPKLQPDWGSVQGSGYGTLTTAYDTSEFTRMIDWGLNQFTIHGLPSPKGYRAGGWFINAPLLGVLSDLGFIYDSSGRESYIFGIHPQKGFWNLSSTTKPYQPNLSNQNSAASPNLRLWEIPNNGLDSTNNTDSVMIAKFKDNYKKLPLTSAQILTYTTHPHWLSIDTPRLEKLFAYIDINSASGDNGPIIYKTIYNAYIDYIK